jgi:predicted lipoprotein with Yx(FWY)xxD motif
MLALASGALALLGGCGSSTKSTSTNASATATPAAQTAQSTTATSPGYGAGGTAAASGGGAAVVLSVKHGKLGTILAAGPKHLTVYLFEGDKGTSSACSGACAALWPPVTTSGTVTGATGVAKAQLATLTRPDGSKQVTYAGHPLYYFTRDKDDGDSYGEGIKSFGSSWYVLAPSGKKVDNS